MRIPFKKTLWIAFLVISVSFGLDAISYFWPFTNNGRPLERVDSRLLIWKTGTESLPTGDYYIAVGRVRGPCRLSVDDKVIASSVGSDRQVLQRLVLGAPFKVKYGEQHFVSVVCSDVPGFKGGLTDAPKILPLSVGISLELYRDFLYLALGALVNLFLLIESAFPSYVLRGSNDQISRKLWVSTTVFALIGLLYSLSLDRLPLLYFGAYQATCIHIVIRSLVGLTFFEVIAAFRSGSRWITSSYVAIILADIIFFVIFQKNPDLVVTFYKLQYPFYSLTTAYVWWNLGKSYSEDGMTELLQILTGSWAIAQAVDFYFLVFDYGFYKSPLVSVLVAFGISIVRRKATRDVQGQLDRALAYSQVVAQVSHDIRSPVAVLYSIVCSATGLDEVTRSQIRNSLERIRETANGLLGKQLDILENENSNSQLKLFIKETDVEPIDLRLQALVSEKRREFEKFLNLEISYRSFNEECLFTSLQAADFDIVMSNLINNAVEAIDGPGKVTVSLRADGEKIILTILDTGIGMNSDVLRNLGKRGFSYGKNGKVSGFGLGVHHAFEVVRSWGGELLYESNLGLGTKAVITLNKADTPAWFANEIKFEEPATVIVLEADVTIFNLWKARFSNFIGVKLIHFTSPEQVLNWFRKEMGCVKNSLFLFDVVPFGSCESGLDLIDRLGVTSNALVVTSRWSEAEVRVRCEKRRMRILPKALVSKVTLISVQPF